MMEEGLVFLRFPAWLHCIFLFLVKSDGVDALRTLNKLMALVELVELPVSATLSLPVPTDDGSPCSSSLSSTPLSSALLSLLTSESLMFTLSNIVLDDRTLDGGFFLADVALDVAIAHATT